MPYLVLLGLILLVTVAAWISSRRGSRADGCCAPADPRDDMRMRGAFDPSDEPDAPSAK